MTHEPNWLLDWYWNDVSGKNVSHLICDHLKGRCKLRMAGDLHHYMRHSCVSSDKPVYVQHLLVNGCGGAFLHPTHVFSNFNKLYGASYKSEAAYPSFEDSSRVNLKIYSSIALSIPKLSYYFAFFPFNSSIIWCSGHLMQIALGNILKFRKKNWQFDFIGGIIYFVLVFSMFPQVGFSWYCSFLYSTGDISVGFLMMFLAC